MTFAERLRELRDAQGLSEAKLAAAAGVSFGAVHQYGLGLRKPSFAAVVKIAKALGVTCEAFAACDDIQAEEQAPVPRAGKAAGKGKGGAKGKGKGK
jgi:transcriptional regulator with XRE-family HTH domain